MEYQLRNYSWPPPDDAFTPSTPGWIQLMRDRFAQVQEMDDRYGIFHQMVHSALLAPNFTEYGFGLARAPDPLIKLLQAAIHEGLETAEFEHEINIILGPRPKFIKRPDVRDMVLHKLQSYAEEWAGMPLIASQAYGFRLYQNNTRLMMHCDRLKTHVISFILHIDSSNDAEPWPLFIEDFYGVTHEVVLTPGDILFYESSKCYHGRPKPFHGSWYTSIFSHYYPLDWKDADHDAEAHYAIPPSWKEDPTGKSDLPKLIPRGMSLEELDCPYGWCRTQDAVKWSGPGVPGYWIKPNQEKVPFHPKEPEFGSDEL